MARSEEPPGVLAPRYGVSTETIRTWRQRGAEDGPDHSARPPQWPGKASEEERAVVCALRQSTHFALDDLTCVVTHFLPPLNRDRVGRIRKAEGWHRRAVSAATQSAQGAGTCKEYDLGFLPIDSKHWPKLQTSHGERRKRYL